MKTAIIFLNLIFSSLVFAIELKTAAQDNAAIKYNPNINGKPGICADIAAELAKLDVKLVGITSHKPLLRIESGLEKGDLDVFLCILKNAEREQKFNFIDIKLYEVNHILVAAEETTVVPKNYEELKALTKDSSVLVPQGSSLIKTLEAVGVNVDSGAKDEVQVLRKILSGRAKYAYFQDLSIMETIKSGGPEFAKIKILPTHFKTEPQYAVYSKKLDPAVVKQLTEAIQKLKSNGTLDKIVEKYR